MDIYSIKTEQEVYAFFARYLREVCYATTTEARVRELLKNITTANLQHMCGILPGGSSLRRRNKKDYVWFIREHFVYKARTLDLFKNLPGGTGIPDWMT